MKSTRERELIGHLLGEAALSPATARWLRTPEGQREKRRLQRVLRRLDGWGKAAAARSDVPSAEILYYGTTDTPVGPVLAAIGGRGLVGVSFGRSARAFERDLAARHRLRVVRADDRLAPVRRQLQRYFGGSLKRFALPIDLRHVSAFQRRVLITAQRIPQGRVVSYGEIARRIGQPRASRAVGQALGHNPIPIVIPCHRVVSGSGRLGGYIGGAAIKRKLLALEGARQALAS